jgi:hypothetical protein
VSISLPTFLRPFFCKHTWIDASRWRENKFIPATRCTTCGKTKFQKTRPRDRNVSGGSGSWQGDDSGAGSAGDGGGWRLNLPSAH